MITDSKWVKDIEPKQGKKPYHQITWHDDKYDNIFDTDFLAIAESAKKDGRLVNFTKDKNQQGFWNITSMELAEIEVQPNQSIPSAQEVPPPLFDMRTPNPRQASIELQCAMKTISDCICGNLLEPDTEQARRLFAWQLDVTKKYAL